MNNKQEQLAKIIQLEKELAVKNRELEIESSLERVRTVAMSMNRPDNLMDICQIVYAELQLLGFSELRNAMINIYNDDKSSFLNYDYSANAGKTVTVMPYNFHPLIEKQVTITKKAKDAFYEFSFTGKELKDFRELRKNNGELDDPKLEDCAELHYYFYSIGTGSIGISTYSSITAEKLNVLKRFRNVFDFAYRRYIDVAQAEAQAREAKIEAALERVRSRTMGMQKSEELKEVIQVVYEQFVHLNIKVEHSGFVMDYKARDDYDIWVADPLGVPSQVIVPYFDSVYYNRFNEAKEKGEDFFATNLTFEEKNKFYKKLFEYVPGLPEQAKEFYFSCPGLAASTVLLENVCLYIENFSGTPYTDEENKTLMRFGKVFQQTYTRFLDLQKAEEQAREAQIETALERVRSRTMAMQKSDELKYAATLLFQQVKALGVPAYSCGYNIWKKGEKEFTSWMSTQDGSDINGVPNISLTEDANFIRYVESKQNSEPFFVLELRGERMQEHYQYLKTIPAFKAYFDYAISVGFDLPQTQIHHLANFSQGNLLFITLEPCPEFHDVFKRFAAVFEQTYTRFLDLQKAEAQAREAKIETALEKVRSRTMAMQKSIELGDVATVLFKEMNHLVDNLWTCGFVLCEKDRAEDEWWLSIESGFIPAFYLPNVGDRVHENLYNGWMNGEAYRTEQIEGAELDEHYEWLMNIPVTKKIFDDMAAAGFQKPTWQKLHAAYFSKGYLCIITRVPCPEEEIFKRFAQVFDLTYTRFLDLQKAEFQTHQAKIETALEKVRARALAMQQPEELTEVAQVMRHEMGLLGVEELETSSIYIHDDGADEAGCWYAIKDIRVPEKKLVADHFVLNLKDTWVGRQMFEFYNSPEKQISIPMQGANRKEWIDYCSKQSKLLEGFYGENIPDRTYHLYKFSNGAIGAASPGDISEESWELLRRATSVFSLAYSRFKDLTQSRIDLQKLKEEKQRAENALTELKSTQSQLIQAEKMASLGELTAGIAHEIQNPLNFVNNFSEVSNELVDEMNGELATGNMQLAIEIANDLKQNLEKINHHGKRAADIVKGMLQHSRNSSGVKESTDINALADEYLRLAYHGLRAKDKSFNAIMKTDFDENIGNVNIIPQDIGRVILNLITNAFYTVQQKSNATKEATPFQKVSPLYEPTVSVSTKKVVNKVEVRVKDNGNGIPQKVLDKIFQPFFTTKPTGQGTGLGLSLSYDIVKAHGGELKVETKEGEGSEFVIVLPG